MAIDPPYRLDPLQNPVNVKWSGEPGEGCGWEPQGPSEYDFQGPTGGAHPQFSFPDGPEGKLWYPFEHPQGIEFDMVYYDGQYWLWTC